MRPYYTPPQTRPKHAKTDLAPWWLYIVLVTISLPFVIFIWAAISVTFHLPPQTGEGWVKVPTMIAEVIAWSFFLFFNRHDKAMDTYLLWSLLVLYGAFFVLLFLIP